MHSHNFCRVASCVLWKGCFDAARWYKIVLLWIRAIGVGGRQNIRTFGLSWIVWCIEPFAVKNIDVGNSAQSSLFLLFSMLLRYLPRSWWNLSGKLDQSLYAGIVYGIICTLDF